MDKTVSIIIPVYNKERYLRKCIDSLTELNIEKEKIEAIFIDDLSSDSSLEILREYEKEHEFIKVIALDKNSGSPSHPRNIGISEAKGTYATLLDADDWLDNEGFPKLLEQMIENDSDFGFGQSYKHTDKYISKLGRFLSYKNENNLVPYEMEKVFRAVGPPGKIFRLSTVVNKDIKFRDMKFGEDKLFFIELISNCENASMSPLPVYHINRYQENVSLVRGTTTLEKAEINFYILQELLTMDIPQSAKNQAISRMIEIDFIQRFFHTKTFLKSKEKDKFYAQFEQVIELLEEAGYDVQNFITLPKFKNIYTLYENDSKKELSEYIEQLISNGRDSRFIKDNVVHKKFHEKFNDLEPVTEECYSVYQGTHVISGEFYEVIHLYKKSGVRIEKVLLSKISDETFEKEIKYELKDNTLYIRTEDINFENVDFNIRIIFDDYKSTLVRESAPNGSSSYVLKRQNYKAEFIRMTNSSIVPVNDYITILPKSVVALRSIYLYTDPDFKDDDPEPLQAGTKINISEITYSSNGTPRLKTEDGYIITANKKYVKRLHTDEIEGYIIDAPVTIRIIKRCKLYDSRNFKDEPVRTLEPGEELEVERIVYTNSLTPRLSTNENLYLTANMKFVEVIAQP